MKRLIMVCAIFVCPILQLSTIYGQMELAVSMPIDQSSSDSSLSSSQNQPVNESLKPIVDDLHEVNLDTFDVDGSGNWLEKRIIYEKAQAIFDEVLDVVSKVVDMRIQFLNEVNAIGHKIDDFVKSVYFDKGQLDDKFKDILATLDAELKLKGDLSQAERELQTSIKQELATIDQLGKNIKLIDDIDIKIDQALMQAFKVIDECREYEAKSWTTFKAIGKEIDDKKARNLYYEIKNYKENIEQKRNYLISSLLPYLHNVLVAKIESIIPKVNDSIAQLKQKGIDLDEIMKTEQDHDFAQLKQREEEAIQIAVDKALQVEHEKEVAAQAKRQADAQKQKEATWSYMINSYYESSVIFLAHAWQQATPYVTSFFMYAYNSVISGVSTVSGVISGYFSASTEKVQKIIDVSDMQNQSEKHGADEVVVSSSNIHDHQEIARENITVENSQPLDKNVHEGVAV